MRNRLILVALTALVARAFTLASNVLHGVVILPFISISQWADYWIYVTQWHYAALGLVPYRDFAFSYTPLFLYALLPFYVLIGSYGPAVLIALSDALTAGLVYLLVLKKAEIRYATAAGLLYALSPFALVNEGYLWLSSQPMTLFVLLSLYLLLDEKPYWSVSALACAALFKQEAIVLLPVFIFWQMKGGSIRVLKGLGVFSAIIAAASAPFMFLGASNYLYSVTYALVKVGPILPQFASLSLSGNWTASFVSLACTNTTVASLYTGAVCGNIGPEALSWVVQQQAVYKAATLLSPAFLALLWVSLYAVRRADNLLVLTCAASVVSLLLLFGEVVHPVLAYYFVPVYALILCASTSRRTLLISSAGALLAAFVPEGILQMLFAIGVLFGLVVVMDIERSRRDQKRTDSPNSWSRSQMGGSGAA